MIGKLKHGNYDMHGTDISIVIPAKNEGDSLKSLLPELVSQIGKLRVCNLVNPEYTALLSVPKTILPKGTVVMGGQHDI